MPDPTLLGNVYPFTFTIRDQNGALAAPATNDLTVTKPDGTTDTKHLADFTNPSTGVYDLDYLPGSAGRYVWYQVSTAPNTAAQGWFDVVAAGTDQTYLDVTDLRNLLGGTESLAGTAASLSDPDLQDAINQAQAEVDGRLSVRYSTPFADPPELIVKITGDIAAYQATLLARRGEPILANEAVVLRYQRAQTLLAQAAAGNLALPVATAPAGPGGEPAVQNPVDGDLWAPADFDLVPRLPSFLPWAPESW